MRSVSSGEACEVTVTLEHHVTLEATPLAAGEGRRFVAEMLCGLYAFCAERAELCVSEMVTNAVIHGSGSVILSIEQNREQLLISVIDRGVGIPVMGRLGPEAESGRGLAIVEWMSDSWGVEELGPGKRVWCSFRSLT